MCIRKETNLKAFSQASLLSLLGRQFNLGPVLLCSKLVPQLGAAKLRCHGRQSAPFSSAMAKARDKIKIAPRLTQLIRSTGSRVRACECSRVRACE